LVNKCPTKKSSVKKTYKAQKVSLVRSPASSASTQTCLDGETLQFDELLKCSGIPPNAEYVSFAPIDIKAHARVNHVLGTHGFMPVVSDVRCSDGCMNVSGIARHIATAGFCGGEGRN
jgi:hypothetical protein